MPSNQTTNYQLSQWAKSDQVRMEDFNADNAKIDAALKAEADARAAETAALTAAVALRGNCQIYTTSYVGSGQAGPSVPNSLTFSKAPVLVVVAGDGAQSSSQRIGFMVQGAAKYSYLCRTPDNATLVWSNDGRTMTWYAQEGDTHEQLNTRNTTYYVVALCPV